MTVSPDQILLTDRVAVVTGAGQGIGEAAARALAQFGCRVAICDWNAETLATTAETIRASGGTVLSSVLDVRDPAAVEAFIGEVAGEFGSINVLVNNVGGGFHAVFQTVSANGEAALIAENFATVTNCLRSAIPHLAEGASIVNVTSVEAHHASPGFGVYGAMKAAVEQFTKTLALELADRGVRVNCVAPDMIPTPGDAGLAGDSSAMSDEHFPTPLRRMGSVDECASVIVFLASDLASFVTGSSIPVDGGTTAGAAWKVARDGHFRM
jgi:3-oxoacyl-[acyl-carrier protein] reductase